MDLTTHVLMANRLHKEITSQTGLYLDYWYYLYGSIKPDIYPEAIEWPHFLNDSLKDLTGYCEYTILAPMSLKEFSVALGVITHFICDYYCLYHSELYRQKNILSHIFYEKKLSLCFIKKCLTHKIKIAQKDTTHLSIDDAISRMHQEYSEEPQGLDLDIQYALNTAMSILQSILVLSGVYKRHFGETESMYDFLEVEGSGL